MAAAQQAPGPEQIGPYQVLRCLGSGGTGTVYLGRDQETGVHAAVKVFGPELAADPRFRDRLRAQLATGYRIPRFCTSPILAAEPDGDPPWLATEYVHAPSLETVLRERGPLPGTEQQALAAGTAAALQEIHHRGGSHGDLKPSDVLIAPPGPRVTDLGLPRPEGAAVYYPAPEQRHGAPPSPATDVFAWACLVTDAAGGTVVDQLRGIVAAALYPEPAARPTAAALVHRLSQLAAPVTNWVLAAADTPPGSRPPELPPDWPDRPQETPAGSSRRPLLVAAVVTALVLVLGIAGVAGWRVLNGDEPEEAAAIPPPAAPASPSTPPLDECLLGTWELTSLERSHVVDDVEVETTSEGGSVTDFRPDGTFETELDQTEVGTAEGQQYEVILTGTITGSYHTEDGTLVWGDTEADGELVVLVDGEEQLRDAVVAISEAGEYECDGDAMLVEYPSNGPHGYTRTS